MTEFRDIMIDLETTGTESSDHVGIIQIAAVRFNYETEEVDFENGLFDRCLSVPHGRYWTESTRSWWQKNKTVLQGILARAEDPRVVLPDFMEFCKPSGRMWAKHIHFDHPLLTSYSRQFDVPFIDLISYRHAVDLPSHIQGLFRVPSISGVKEKFTEPEFVGNAHNALHDCFHQIKVLFAAKAASRA